MRPENYPTELDKEVKALIDKCGVPSVLRAFQRVCEATYHDMSTLAYHKHFEQERLVGYDEEPPREIRYDSDVASAWMCLQTEYLAKSFEDRMKHAGESNDEREIRNRQEALDEAIRKVEYLKSQSKREKKS